MIGDEDDNWQDECFKLMRLNAGVIAEYLSTVPDMNSPAGWAITDLRDVNHELLIAVENADEGAAESLLVEARLLFVEVIRLAG